MKNINIYSIIAFLLFLVSCKENQEKLEVPEILEKENKNIDFEINPLLLVAILNTQRLL